MTYYATFGGCLRSEQLPFPDLPFSQVDTPDWFLRVADGSSQGEVGELLGAWPESYCKIQLYRIPNGFRLRHSCTGEFDISANGTELVWYPCLGAKKEMARYDVLGRVLSVALHAAGGLTLHGSAVALDHGVIAFLAPKSYGKSTLAAALTRVGARLVTDDMVAVELGSPIQIRSGIHSVRLCSDTIERLIADETPTRFSIDGKHIVDHTDPASVMLGKAPLSAVYLLQPVESANANVAASRRKLSSIQAAMSLLAHAKIGPLLGKSEARALFDRSVTLANATPVYRLEVARDFDRMDEAVSTILGWHDTEVPVLA